MVDHIIMVGLNYIKAISFAIIDLVIALIGAYTITINTNYQIDRFPIILL